MFDISYVTPSPNGEVSPAQKLDLYWPAEGEGPFPVIISIHGGAFMIGDKRDIQLTPMLAGLKRGFAVASINYRMSGEAIFPALVHDVKAAIRWVRANAAQFLFDPDKIAVWGGSAGGYLALMAGVSAGIPELDDLSLGNPEQSARVQAVVDWFGPTDFLKMDAQLEASGFPQTPKSAHNGPNSPESLILGQQITQIPEVVQAANPETYIRPSLPPFLIQHGDQDDTVPYQQSVNMAAKLSAVLGLDKVTLEILPNARHGDPAFAHPHNVAKVLNFLDGVFSS
ncbi:MAG: alpha/beta hydrolase [Anaerolineae bacterium]|nr:alpha/beta hydrolase [Anaerolineae bacterium]